MPAFSLGALFDDRSSMPDDIIAPRLLTPGGMLVLGGAPKVGKSDFLIHLLVHMAAGVPFLGFAPPRALRDLLPASGNPVPLSARTHARHPARAVGDGRRAQQSRRHAEAQLMLLDERGVAPGHGGDSRRSFPDDAARHHLSRSDPQSIRWRRRWRRRKRQRRHDVLPDRTGSRLLREAVAPEPRLILVHHTRKMNKKHVAEDPFQALSGASALRASTPSGSHAPAGRKRH